MWATAPTIQLSCPACVVAGASLTAPPPTLGWRLASPRSGGLRAGGGVVGHSRGGGVSGGVQTRRETELHGHSLASSSSLSASPPPAGACWTWASMWAWGWMARPAMTRRAS
ncbi:hypothetical protein HaLaN_07545 [Haematococcus lacustris]|uniref:Uncharacterized protein n=1 Tax=Haematococcus lacustris TaxID=44745 RepID=A0A699YPR2_HAELA|nr:hypothetical protein HaLaN_07545 [Haematococcus lacustris]